MQSHNEHHIEHSSEDGKIEAEEAFAVLKSASKANSISRQRETSFKVKLFIKSYVAELERSSIAKKKQYV